jgi:hypothetical protein
LKYFVKEVNEISRSKESGTPKKKKKNELVQSSFLLSLQYKNNTLKRERGKKKKPKTKKLRSLSVFFNIIKNPIL